MNTEFQSKIHRAGDIKFPTFRNAQLYMHPIVAGRRDRDFGRLPKAYGDFERPLDEMLASTKITKDTTIYITIDQSRVRAGNTHRRAGAHVDGNYIFDWAGGGDDNRWITDELVPHLGPAEHRVQYCNPNGGVILASNVVGCQAWRGTLEGAPGQGGDCEHLKDQLAQLPNFLLVPNAIYVGNSTMVHESLPQDQDVERTLMRITLSPEHLYTSRN